MSHGRFLTDEQDVRELLESATVRVTTQRLGLAMRLFGGAHRHVTASELHLEAARRGLPISVATVYNTLSHFVRAGLLREVSVGSDRTYFDTNVDDHGHIYDETTGALRDIPLPRLRLPEGVDEDSLRGVEVMFRVRS